MNKLRLNVKRDFNRFICKSQCVFASKKGEGMIDIAVVVLISVVLGALVLAGLYALMGNTVLPTLTQKIQDMFNYSK